jgi:glyoxylase-like metal-dependent hydrolase (beta-lactamase superfamily II)
VIIDPGDDPERVVDAARAAGIRVVAILHTHAHFDHITGTPPVHEATGGPILIHRADRWLYENVALQGRLFGFPVPEHPAAIDRFIEEGDVIGFGDHALTVLHTPGHTPGSCCFRLDGPERLLFSGDTLFARGIGRPDLWGGDAEAELRSIRDKLLPLDPDTRVFPGHGPDTRIGAERKHNPFVK